MRKFTELIITIEMANAAAFLQVLAVFVEIVVKIDAQIPLQCANIESLSARSCCPTPAAINNTDPGPCGVHLGRGSCQPVAIPESKYDPKQKDIRVNWPIQYFNSTCVCGERYGGVDCGECSYAYNDGTTECKTKTVLPRKSVGDLSDEDWEEYVNALIRAQAAPSRYMVVLVNYTTDLQALLDSMVRPSIYHMFVWSHYTASNSPGEGNKDDLAHQGPGFPTWHRWFILWFEREMQVMLGDHTFRLHFWNWLDPDQRPVPFKHHRLGATHNTSTIVTGDLVNANWSMMCWDNRENSTTPYDICDPRKLSSSVLIRCPNSTLCEKNNLAWPSYKDYHAALSLSSYDVSPYDGAVKCTEESYRSYMEGFLSFKGECGNDPMCIDYGGGDASKLMLHNVIHTLLGLGTITDSPAFEDQGVMGDGASSPNDPIFLNHHTMVDCMLEEWIQKYEAEEWNYPTSKRIKAGHRAADYIVPFIPVYQQREMLVTADNFGYSCHIPESSRVASASSLLPSVIATLSSISLSLAILITL